MTSPAAGASALAGPGLPRKKLGLGKKLLIAFLSLLLVLAVAAGILLAVKPWAPEVVVVDAGSTGRRITDNGMIANYYPAAGPGPHAAVIVVGGSDGGIGAQVDRTARTLQAEGFTALALSYWGAEGQPQRMEAVPLETFATAFEWLKAQPGVDAERLGLIGMSKGGEAAVLLASRTPDLKAVVGYVPSHVVWAGINLREPWKQMTIGSTWSQNGQQLPYLPYSRKFRGGPVLAFYTLSLEGLPQHPEATIPIERSGAPLLLVCGEKDNLWPSCRMARELQRRAREQGGPKVTVLAYPDAGHMLLGPPNPDENFPLTLYGGTEAAGNAALRDSWPKVVEFLRNHLR